MAKGDQSSPPEKVVLDHWWLTGEEQCEACDQRYAYEVEVRCIDCDAALCPLCAQWQAPEFRCVDCATSGGA